MVICLLKVINISGQTLGLFDVINGRVTQDNVSPGDYRVVEELTSQMKRLADPSMRLLKILYKEVEE